MTTTKAHTLLPAGARFNDWAHAVIIVLSVVLIVYISVLTFMNVDFMANRGYMHFQLWVCIAFMADYFIELAFARRKWRYALRNLPFLIISVPYLNLISLFDIEVPYIALMYLQYVPLVRGVAAMVLVFTYVNKNKIVGIFTSYVAIMVLMCYSASLIFYARESAINPEINTYWTSLWWCCLEMTTIGSPINPLTVTGKVLAAILSAMGMMMFPLFTVYLTQKLKKYIKPNK